MEATSYKRHQPVRVLSYSGQHFDHDWSQTGRIVKADRPDWYIVRFDCDSATLCVHAERLMPSNAA